MRDDRQLIEIDRVACLHDLFDGCLGAIDDDRRHRLFLRQVIKRQVRNRGAHRVGQPLARTEQIDHDRQFGNRAVQIADFLEDQDRLLLLGLYQLHDGRDFEFSGHLFLNADDMRGQVALKVLDK